jgi:hypothetical protein
MSKPWHHKPSLPHQPSSVYPLCISVLYTYTCNCVSTIRLCVLLYAKLDWLWQRSPLALTPQHTASTRLTRLLVCPLFAPSWPQESEFSGEFGRMTWVCSSVPLSSLSEPTRLQRKPAIAASGENACPSKGDSASAFPCFHLPLSFELKQKKTREY